MINVTTFVWNRVDKLSVSSRIRYVNRSKYHQALAQNNERYAQCLAYMHLVSWLLRVLVPSCQLDMCRPSV